MADQKTPKEYRRLPYRRLVEIERGAESGRDHFVAYVEEIPWIRIPGDSREEALLNLDVAVEQMRLAVGDQSEPLVIVQDTDEMPPWTKIEQGNVELAGVL